MNSLHIFKAGGRLSLGNFWLSASVVWFVFYFVSSVAGNNLAPALTWLINGSALIVLGLLCIMRLHDRNHSGWWLLLVLLPVVGALWLVWQCAFRRGLAQGNRWGEDPLQSRGDYLVVR